MLPPVSDPIAAKATPAHATPEPKKKPRSKLPFTGWGGQLSDDEHKERPRSVGFYRSSTAPALRRRFTTVAE